jgi:phosphatidylglycerophosphatase A
MIHIPENHKIWKSWVIEAYKTEKYEKDNTTNILSSELLVISIFSAILSHIWIKSIYMFFIFRSFCTIKMIILEKWSQGIN